MTIRTEALELNVYLSALCCLAAVWGRDRTMSYDHAAQHYGLAQRSLLRECSLVDAPRRCNNYRD